MPSILLLSSGHTLSRELEAWGFHILAPATTQDAMLALSSALIPAVVVDAMNPVTELVQDLAARLPHHPALLATSLGLVHVTLGAIRVGEPAVGVGEALSGRGASLGPLAEVERRHILAVYEGVGRNKSRAARVLDIGLQTLQRKLKAYDAC